MRRVQAVAFSILTLAMTTGGAAQTSAGRAPEGDVRARFAGAIEARDLAEAIRLAELALRSAPGQPALLDEITYRLASAGATAGAARILLRTYPFETEESAMRELLIGRLFHLLDEAASPVPVFEADLERLRVPLDSPRLRGYQAAFWAERGDCRAVASILGDLSSDYVHDDLLRLADCVRDASPAVAHVAYARAHAMAPGGAASRALAYSAHARGDYRIALDTWRAIGPALSTADLRAAAASAIAAGDAQQAELWIDALGRDGAMRDGDTTIVALLMDCGYLHLRQGRTRSARTAFERAWSIGRRLAAAEQLVYLTQQLHDNAAARAYAERAIDLHASARPIESRHREDSRDRLFALRRLHEDLGRRVTISLDGWTGPRTGSTLNASQPGRTFSSYTQLEIDYRLGRQTIRNGSSVSLFTRMLADGGSPGSPWPADNATLGAGIRWKPLRRQVLFLSAEAQSGLENREYRDVLVRASASLFNGSHGDDWHPSGTGWLAQNLYLDAAHYVDGARTALTADYRVSYHGKVTSVQTMEPYAHLQVNGVRTGAFDRDVRAGLGVRWNLWYGASRYDAPAHKLSLGVEFQQAFETFLNERRGVFFTLGTRW